MTTQSTHTQGEWAVGKSGNTVSGGDPQFCIAELGGIYPEKKANARLIAAAPKQNAALNLLIQTAETAHATSATEAEVIAANWDVLGPLIRAAIAAAKGE